MKPHALKHLKPYLYMGWWFYLRYTLRKKIICMAYNNPKVHHNNNQYQAKTLFIYGRCISL